MYVRTSVICKYSYARKANAQELLGTGNCEDHHRNLVRQLLQVHTPFQRHM